MRGRNLITRGGTTSASCANRGYAAPRPAHFANNNANSIMNQNNNHGLSPSQNMSFSYPSGSQVSSIHPKTEDHNGDIVPLPTVTQTNKANCDDTSPRTGKGHRSRSMKLSELHKLIRERSNVGQDAVSGRIRISIKRADAMNKNKIKAPNVEVVILNPETVKTPVLHKGIAQKTQDTGPGSTKSSSESEKSLMFEEWKHLPHLNQKDLLKKLDADGISSLERTKLWLVSNPLGMLPSDDVEAQVTPFDNIFHYHRDHPRDYPQKINLDLNVSNSRSKDGEERQEKGTKSKKKKRVTYKDDFDP